MRQILHAFFEGLLISAESAGANKAFCVHSDSCHFRYFFFWEESACLAMTQRNS
jgi:hypothetical protein